LKKKVGVIIKPLLIERKMLFVESKFIESSVEKLNYIAALYNSLVPHENLSFKHCALKPLSLSVLEERAL